MLHFLLWAMVTILMVSVFCGMATLSRPPGKELPNARQE